MRQSSRRWKERAPRIDTSSNRLKTPEAQNTEEDSIEADWLEVTSVREGSAAESDGTNEGEESD